MKRGGGKINLLLSESFQSPFYCLGHAKLSDKTIHHTGHLLLGSNSDVQNSIGLVSAASNSAGIWDSDNCSSQELFLDAKEPHPLYILHGVHSIFQQFAIARFGNAPLCCVSCAALAGPAMALLPGDSMVTSFAWKPFWQKTWCYSVQLLHPGMTHP